MTAKSDSPPTLPQNSGLSLVQMSYSTADNDDHNDPSDDILESSSLSEETALEKINPENPDLERGLNKNDGREIVNDLLPRPPDPPAQPVSQSSLPSRGLCDKAPINSDTTALMDGMARSRGSPHRDTQKPNRPTPCGDFIPHARIKEGFFDF